MNAWAGIIGDIGKNGIVIRAPPWIIPARSAEKRPQLGDRNTHDFIPACWISWDSGIIHRGTRSYTLKTTKCLAIQDRLNLSLRPRLRRRPPNTKHSSRFTRQVA